MERSLEDSIKNKTYIDNLRSAAKYSKEVIDLVEADIEYGLTMEQTKLYLKREIKFPQMKLLSQCLRKGADEAFIELLTKYDMSGYQIQVAIEFMEKGKKSLSEAADRLEKRCDEIKQQIFEVKESIKSKAGEIMADFKMRGKAALNRVSEFIGLKDKLVGIRNKVKEGIADTNRTIAKIDSFGKGIREAGQKVANTFRTFADKEEVDYSEKEKKFSKTEVAKKPWKWQKKVYESMVLHLDAAIDKVEDLSRDVELYRMEKKQIDKPEHVTDIRDTIAPVSSVAEPTEYQFGAEAFEAAYPKMDSVIKPDAKAPSVPKTGKVR